MNPYALAAFLVLVGNAADVFDAGGLPGGSPAHLLVGLALSALLLAQARRDGLSRHELGLVNGPTAAVGAALGLTGALLGLLVLRFPLLLPAPITYAPLRAMDAVPLALHVAVFLPLAVVLPEELAFRGVLLAGLRRRTTTLRAIVVTSVAFAAWHATILLPTIEQTELAARPVPAALALAGATAVLLAGGGAFAVLRLRGDSLAVPIAAHWTFNATLLVGLRLLG